MPLTNIGLPPPPPPGPNKTLGDKVRNTIVHALLWVIDTVTQPLQDGIGALGNRLSTWILKDLQRWLGPAFDEVIADEDTPAWLKKVATDVKTATGSPGGPAVVMGLLGVLGMLMGQVIMGPLRLFSMKFMRKFRPGRPSYRDLATWGWKRVLTGTQVRAYMEDMGMPDDVINAVVLDAEQVPTLGLLEELLYRGLLSPERVRRFLELLGYDSLTIGPIMESFTRLVSASDLERMAIREVFTYPLNQPLKVPEPGPRYYEEMALQGFNQERAEWFWMAHWRLISETRGEDIVRRLGRGGTIAGQPTKEWFEELLRRNDVLSKYWEPMWQTRYRVINRLDIWRLALAGAFDRDQVYELYLDYGYSPELASTMADAATSTRLREGTNLSRADIASGYQRGMFNRDEALAMLIDIGYTEDEAEFFLAKADLDSTTSNAASRASIVRQKFLTGLLDDAAAAAELAALGKEAPEIDSLLSLWRLQKEDRLERPTISQLAEFYSRSIITGPVLRAEILGHGYSDRYVDWYITNIEAEIDERNAKLSEADLRRKLAILRQPTRSDLLSFYRAGLITIEDFTRRLLDQGYTQEDVAKYASLAAIEPITPFYKTEEGKLRLAALKEAVRRGLITPEGFRTGLANLAVPPELADAIADYEEVRLAAREERI